MVEARNLGWGDIELHSMNHVALIAGLMNRAFAGTVVAALIETPCVTSEKGRSNFACVRTPGEQPGG